MKQTLIVVLVVLVLVAVGGTIYVLSIDPTGREDANHPLNQVSEWICLAGEEPHDFTMTVREIAQAQDGVVCKICGSTEVSRALPCPECGRHYPVGRYNASPTNCFHCGAELPGKDFSVFHSHEGH